jgi:diguanylate cyclase (GGDEF)-like protein
MALPRPRDSRFPTEPPAHESGARPALPNIWDEDETDESIESYVRESFRGPTKPSLTFLSGMRAGEMIVLEDGEVSIGRSARADIVIDDAGASRVHCVIVPRGRSIEIEDLNSSNGTRVNGVRLSSRRRLTEGDRIHIGHSTVVQLRFVDEVEDTVGRMILDASTRDPLTNLHNRRYFHRRLEGEISYARRHGRHLACIVLDLDYFKSVNDRYGHKAGDEVLRAVADVFANCVRTEDVVARLGGEEFAILLRVNNLEDARHLAERIRVAVSALSGPFGQSAIALTVSAGVAELSEIGQWDVHLDAEGEELVALADRRLYRAKSLGRNRVCASSS